VSRKKPYVPDRGDAVWITLDPLSGHEQAGRRPALVLSPAAYNGRVGLALLCPITGQAKGYPFEVEVPSGLAVTGVALADHVKSLDWRARKATRICLVPQEVVAAVISRLNALLAG
jgi:mRNA interferase MazF